MTFQIRYRRNVVSFIIMYENIRKFIIEIFCVKGKNQSESSVQNLHTSILEQLLEQNEPKKDEVDCFLEQIGFILRKLKYRRRRQVQLDILQLFYKAEDKEGNESS